VSFLFFILLNILVVNLCTHKYVYMLCICIAGFETEAVVDKDLFSFKTLFFCNTNTILNYFIDINIFDKGLGNATFKTSSPCVLYLICCSQGFG